MNQFVPGPRQLDHDVLYPRWAGMTVWFPTSPALSLFSGGVCTERKLNVIRISEEFLNVFESFAFYQFIYYLILANLCFTIKTFEKRREGLHTWPFSALFKKL